MDRLTRLATQWVIVMGLIAFMRTYAPTVQDEVGAYIEQYSAVAKKLTRKAKEVDLAYLTEFVGAKKLSEIKKADIDDFLLWRAQQGDSPATVQRRLANTKHFFKHVSETHGQKNPAKDVKAVALQQKPYQGLSEEEEHRLLDACRDIKERFIVELLLNTGLRVQEATLINAYQAHTRKIHSVWRKGGSHTDIMINGRLAPIFAEYLLYRKGELVVRAWGAKTEDYSEFPLILSPRGGVTPDSSRATSKYIYRVIKGACKRAGIRKCVSHPHALRHTFAKRLLKATNNDVALVARLMNHRSIQTTMRYLGTTEDEERAGIELL